ncbi:MAG: XisI protein [Bacteroidota bacterium]
MDGIENKRLEYQNYLVEILQSLSQEFKLQSELADVVIADRENGHFQLLRMGWIEDDRILQILVHFDLKEDGKIWIQENVTELAVDEELLKKGVPASDIVLAMHPPVYRKFTEFAEA